MNKEETKKKKQIYYQNNKEKILEGHREYYKVRKEEFRARAVRYKFGISLDEYETMAKNQNNLCAICGKPEISTRNGKIKQLAVDHNHTTKKVRELLCEHCNTVIGKVYESTEILEKMIVYLKKHK